MSVLLDTVTISVLVSPNRTPRVAEWLMRHDGADSMSATSVGEIERGIARVVGQQPVFAARLSDWSMTLRRVYRDSIVDFGVAKAVAWGQLSARLGHRDPDLRLAATALVHDLAVVTRNVRHLEPAGVRVVNPWTTP